jgi:hypothetical protein
MVRIGKELTDITQCRRAEQRVCYRMQERIGIAVTDQMAIMPDGHAAKSQWTTFGQSVRIMSDPNAVIQRANLLMWHRLPACGL